MKKIIISTILAVFALTLLAQNTPEDNAQYGFKMLQIAPSASAMATAGAGRINKTDAFSFLASPEMSMINKTKALSANQTMWLFDTNISSVAITSFSNNSATSFGVRWLDYGKIDERDEQNQVIGEFTPIDIDAVFNYSYRITPDYYAGFNLHMLYEKLNSSSAVGAAIDLGFTYLTPVKGLSLGVVAKNLGKTGKMNEEEIDLVKTFAFSAVHKYDFTPQVCLNSEANINKEEGEDDLKTNLGISVSYNKMFNLKGGYKINDDSIDFSAGLGFMFSQFTLDYAFVNTKDEHDTVHSIGVGYLF